jgi:hypothetical protein
LSFVNPSLVVPIGFAALGAAAAPDGLFGLARRTFRAGAPLLVPPFAAPVASPVVCGSSMTVSAGASS